MNIKKMPAVSVTFFDPEKSLLGIDCEVLNMCDGFRPDKTIIISRYASVSLGIIVATINFCVKLRGDV